MEKGGGSGRRFRPVLSARLRVGQLGSRRAPTQHRCGDRLSPRLGGSRKRAAPGPCHAGLPLRRAGRGHEPRGRVPSRGPWPRREGDRARGTGGAAGIEARVGQPRDRDRRVCAAGLGTADGERVPWEEAASSVAPRWDALGLPDMQGGGQRRGSPRSTATCAGLRTPLPMSRAPLAALRGRATT